jgi:S1-C subfamily serine protease
MDRDPIDSPTPPDSPAMWLSATTAPEPEPAPAVAGSERPTSADAGGSARPPRAATRTRAVAGMAALALVSATIASGGTVAALAASGALARPAVTVVAGSTPAQVAGYVTPGGTVGSSDAAAAPSSDVVVSVAAKVSPAVVTIVTSSSTAATGTGQGTAPFGQGQNPFGQGIDPFGQGNGGTQGGSGSNGSGGSQGGSAGQSQYGLPAGQVPVSVGSGVIFDSNGWILTNHHVVADGGTLTVQLSDGRSFPATVYGTDTLTDLAIVKIDATGLPTATLGDSATIKVGQLAIALGDPLGDYPGTVTTGVVSGLGRTISDSTSSLNDLIQTDAAINPGNSGGPLLDSNGAVIGIDTAIAPSAQGIGFAIPINVARPLTEQALAGLKLSRPWLGVRYQALDAGIAARNGLTVTSGAWITAGDSGGTAVESGSPAATAGLRENDVITAVDGVAVDTNHPLVELLATHAPGSTVDLTVRRGASNQTISVTLTTRPATTN